MQKFYTATDCGSKNRAGRSLRQRSPAIRVTSQAAPAGPYKYRTVEYAIARVKTRRFTIAIAASSASCNMSQRTATSLEVARAAASGRRRLAMARTPQAAPAILRIIIVTVRYSDAVPVEPCGPRPLPLGGTQSGPMQASSPLINMPQRFGGGATAFANPIRCKTVSGRPK